MSEESIGDHAATRGGVPHDQDANRLAISRLLAVHALRRPGTGSVRSVLILSVIKIDTVLTLIRMSRVSERNDEFVAARAANHRLMS